MGSRTRYRRPDGVGLGWPRPRQNKALSAATPCHRHVQVPLGSERLMKPSRGTRLEAPAPLPVTQPLPGHIPAVELPGATGRSNLFSEWRALAWLGWGCCGVHAAGPRFAMHTPVEPDAEHDDAGGAGCTCVMGSRDGRSWPRPGSERGRGRGRTSAWGANARGCFKERAVPPHTLGPLGH